MYIYDHICKHTHTKNFKKTRRCEALSWKLQHAATHFNMLQHTSTYCNMLRKMLQHTATCDPQNMKAHGDAGLFRGSCNTLQHAAAHCDTLQHAATCFSTLQHTVTCCDMLQHAATRCNMQDRRDCCIHCNALQHAATRCNTL